MISEAIVSQKADIIVRDLAALKAASALEFFTKRYVGGETHEVPEWVGQMYRQNAACLPKLVSMYSTETMFNDAALGKVEVPVNLISGSFGRWSSRAINDQLGDGFSKAPHILLPGAITRRLFIRRSLPKRSRYSLSESARPAAAHGAPDTHSANRALNSSRSNAVTDLTALMALMALMALIALIALYRPIGPKTSIALLITSRLPSR